jgi:hypothetical protein
MPLNSTETKEIRRFGLIAVVFFGTLLGLGLWLGRPITTYLGGVLGALGFALFLLPQPLRPVYRIWLKVGHFIGKVVTTSVLVLAYYLVITPGGLLKRVFGGRPIAVRPDKGRTSYWVPREEPAQPKERFLKRY